MNKNKKIGFVYILTNPSFKEDWVKIGQTGRTVEVRIKELNNTAVPLPFNIFAVMKTAKYEEAEKQIHGFIDTLTDLRVSPHHEFFNVTTEKALELFRKTAMTLDDAEIILYENNKPIVNKEEVSKEELISFAEGGEKIIKNKNEWKVPNRQKPSRTGQFDIFACGIGVGTKLLFKPAKIIVKVSNQFQIEYKGENYSLSGFTKKFMPEKQKHPCGTYDGPKYFIYNGKSLKEIVEKGTK